ncbi:hypothetical protein [Pseudoponticoccus marisrubri]|uniref:DUF2834 domain-containing protein n=1 Tax=Pseudoponticoccus marisrubri TaxID=1685382 RepID=A0A0W7WMB4_9RHOB|nr:hypothetical protein [Pseudoponticoccus marisrubri]KUF11730.1 hypothetical protein AVJ23_03855 [Pseudoponticoccus marisrubri]
MTLLQILPVLAYAGCVGTILLIAQEKTVSALMRWVVPAVLGAVFLAFSLYQVSQDGLIQFWINHTTDLTGNQVWFDLIMAVTIGFYLLAPRARAVGMPLMPWGIAVFLTACIALLPMLARVLWLENKARA